VQINAPVPLIVRLTYEFATAILPEAALSYIRVGPPHPWQCCPYDQIRVARLRSSRDGGFRYGACNPPLGGIGGAENDWLLKKLQAIEVAIR
jgi:hypothetical protein